VLSRHELDAYWILLNAAVLRGEYWAARMEVSLTRDGLPLIP